MTGRDDGEVITAAEVEAELERIGHELKPLDIVLVHTGRDEFYDQLDYIARGPGVSAEATRWLHDRGVRVMGIDAWGWDRAASPPGRRGDRARRARDLLGGPPGRPRLLADRAAGQPRRAPRRRLQGRLLPAADRRRQRRAGAGAWRVRLLSRWQRPRPSPTLELPELRRARPRACAGPAFDQPHGGARGRELARAGPLGYGRARARGGRVLPALEAGDVPRQGVRGAVRDEGGRARRGGRAQHPPHRRRRSPPAAQPGQPGVHPARRRPLAAADARVHRRAVRARSRRRASATRSRRSRGPTRR